jgi:hypothetical protein
MARLGHARPVRTQILRGWIDFAVAGDANAPAGLAAATGDVPQPEATIAPNAGGPTAAGSALQPTVTTSVDTFPARTFVAIDTAIETALRYRRQPNASVDLGAPLSKPEVEAPAGGPTAAGTAPQPTVITGTLANAGGPTAAGSALQPEAEIGAKPGAPTAAGTAPQPTVQTSMESRPTRITVVVPSDNDIRRRRRQAFAAFVDLGAPIIIEDVSANAGLASASGTANAATAGIDAKPAGPTAAGTAPQPTIVTGTLANAGLASATGSALQPEATIGAKPGAPTAAGTSDGQTVETGAFANAPAGLAAAAGSAFPATIRIQPNAGVGLAAGVASQPEAEIGAKPGFGSAAGTAPQPTVQFGALAQAGLAAGTGTANTGKAAIRVAAGVTAAAGDAGAVFGLVGNPTGPGQPVTVYDPPAAVSVEGGVGIIIRENEDAVEVR